MKKSLILDELLEKSQWDLTQEDAYNILLQLKCLLAEPSVGYITKKRLLSRALFALCELYKALLNKDYVDACGTIYFLSTTHLMEDSVVGAAVYRALVDTVGDTKYAQYTKEASRD